MEDLEVTLTTERLTLTPLVLADAEEMVDVLADPALGTFTGDEPPSLVELLRSYTILETRHEPGGEARWLNWIVRMDGRAIGYVQATVRGPEAFLAWLITMTLQGHGYATEAARAVVSWLVRDLGVNRGAGDDPRRPRRVAGRGQRGRSDADGSLHRWRTSLGLVGRVGLTTGASRRSRRRAPCGRCGIGRERTARSAGRPGR